MGGFQERIRGQLTLVVRQLAWLGAVPQPAPGSAEAKAGKRNTLSRRDELKKNGIVPSLPPNPMPQLMLWFTNIGMVSAGGMGPTPLSWSEITAWQRCTGIRLAPWHAQLLRNLSIAYIAETANAEAENAPAPWRREITQREREVDEAALDVVFG